MCALVSHSLQPRQTRAGQLLILARGDKESIMQLDPNYNLGPGSWVLCFLCHKEQKVQGLKDVKSVAKSISKGGHNFVRLVGRLSLS